MILIIFSWSLPFCYLLLMLLANVAVLLTGSIWDAQAVRMHIGHDVLNKSVSQQMSQVSSDGHIDYCTFEKDEEFLCDVNSTRVWKRQHARGAGTSGSVLDIIDSNTGEEAVLKTAITDLQGAFASSFGEVFGKFKAAEQAKLSYGQMNCRSIHDEVDAMESIKAHLTQLGEWNGNCEDVMMSYMSAKPCVLDLSEPEAKATPSKASFVMKKMSGDLKSYMVSSTSEQLADCMPDIVRKVRKALICIHKAGRAHMDIKASNFLVQFQQGECPTEVRMIDFADSAVIGSAVYYKDERLVSYADYMPEKMFANSEAGRTGKFTVSAKYDWCMFALLFGKIPQAWPAGQWDDGWHGDCGMMGPNRQKNVILNNNQQADGF